MRIDADLVGRPRAEFFQRRLAAALARPEIHVQYGVDGPSGLEGYALARVMAGEFGLPLAALRLQAIGVRREAQGHGVGRALMTALEDAASARDAGTLRTTAAWNDHGMLRFLDHHGFSLAENQVLDCAVHLGRLEPVASASDVDETADSLERDRADVRTLTSGDLRAVVRIDRKLTGLDRPPYMQRKIEAALGESDIGVSLAAWEDVHIVGFVMARVDLGDSGRMASAAVLDTLGVDPDFSGRGVGHALVSQLFANLAALHVERVETVVSKADFKLLGFLYRIGFGASQRLAFKKVARALAPAR